MIQFERVLFMCKVYGYARISRPTQNIERQIRNIKEYDSTVKVYAEAYTGTKSNRPEWIKLLKTVTEQINKGEKDITIIFDSVSRMSRNAEEGVKQYEELYNMGVSLVFLKEPHINTTVYKDSLKQQLALTGNKIADEYIKATNNVLMILAKKQVELAFEQAEKEVQDLHKRTSEGLQTAKLKGKQVGRKQGTTVETEKAKKAKQIILKHAIDFGGSLTDKEVMQMIGGIARNSYYKYKRELKT